MNFQRIYEFDLANGSGVRISLFVSGCSIRCPGCFNKEAWDFCSGKPFTKKHFKAIERFLQDERYTGLSILGGEPFDQDKKGLKTLIKLAKKAHKYNKDVWIWTGHNIKDFKNNYYQEKLLNNCDVVIDSPFIEELKDSSLPFMGSKNQRRLIKGESGWVKVS